MPVISSRVVCDERPPAIDGDLSSQKALLEMTAQTTRLEMTAHAWGLTTTKTVKLG